MARFGYLFTVALAFSGLGINLVPNMLLGAQVAALIYLGAS